MSALLLQRADRAVPLEPLLFGAMALFFSVNITC